MKAIVIVGLMDGDGRRERAPRLEYEVAIPCTEQAVGDAAVALKRVLREASTAETIKPKEKSHEATKPRSATKGPSKQ